MVLSLADVISFIAIFLFWLLTACLLSHPAGRRAGNWLLAAFLVSKSLCFLNGILFRFAAQLAPVVPHAFYLGFSFEFLLGPALYFYTRSLVGGGFAPRPRSLLHLTPFLAHLAYMTWRFHRFDGATKTRLLLGGGVVTGWEQQLVDTAVFLQFLAYLTASVALFLRYRRRIRDVYSSLDNRRLAWLGSLLFYFLAIWVVGYVNVTLWNLRLPVRPIPGFVFDLLLLSFATMIVFFGLREPKVFAEPEADAEGRQPRARLSPEDAERLRARLTTAVERGRPYLNPDVTLGDLARCAGISARDLTSLLREALGTCFYDYVNRHRVEEAKRLLTFKDSDSVLEILQRAGFRSKSVFHTAFKKQTGLTPTEYRKAHAVRRPVELPERAVNPREQIALDGSAAASRTTLQP